MDQATEKTKNKNIRKPYRGIRGCRAPNLPQGGKDRSPLSSPGCQANPVTLLHVQEHVKLI